jgi:hypothetical protein
MRRAAGEVTGWRIAASSPDYSGGDGFRDIAATGPDDAWAVGTGPCCAPDGRKISHWDGTAWQPVTLPDGIEDVHAISATAANDVWLMGWNGDAPVTLHWKRVGVAHDQPARTDPRQGRPRGGG